MNKLPYSSPDVICLELMTGAILEGSDDSNTISSYDLFDLDEE